MYIFSYLVRTTLIFAIDVILTLMFISAVMSWIAPASSNRFMVFVRGVVDAVTYPVKRIIMRSETARMFPIDLSFTITAIILFVLQSLLMI